MPIDSLTGPVPPFSGSPTEKASDLQEMKLRKAVADFEAIFIQYLLKCMRQTVPRSDLFGGGSSQDLCQGLLDEELSRTVAKGRGIGLSKVMLEKLLQERQAEPSTKGTDRGRIETRPTEKGGERGPSFRLHEEEEMGR